MACFMSLTVLGCFCNVGACHHWLDITPAMYKQNLAAGISCGDNHDVVRSLFGLQLTVDSVTVRR